MNQGEETDKKTILASHRTLMANARSHMANERTHLAYLRTSLSLMGFGITLNRFSLYLKKGKVSPVRVPYILDQTEIIGAGISILAVFILCWALYRYRLVNKEIDNRTYKTPHFQLTILTSVILILSIITTLWILVSWR